MNDLDHLLESYDYDLPQELIAERPMEKRDESRLFFIDGVNNSHRRFHEISSLIPKGALIVRNQSKVFPCRVFGNKTTGAKAEFFFLEHESPSNTFPCLIKSSSKKKIGDTFVLNGGSAEITQRNDDGTFVVKFTPNENFSSLAEFLEKEGMTPIPPYIRGGESDDLDQHSYQTTYAKHVGSVAAPTAGLHFTKDLTNELLSNGIDIAHVTLHVGLGTFSPIKTDDIRSHKMHEEKYFIEDADLQKIKKAYAEGRPVIAVGTTSLRVLESAFDEISSDSFIPNKLYSTRIFIHPGKVVKSISGLITNFHLPKSSLIMLTAALVGRENILNIYKEAVDNKYRFFSYGDAMFIKVNP